MVVERGNGVTVGFDELDVAEVVVVVVVTVLDVESVSVVAFDVTGSLLLISAAVTVVVSTSTSSPNTGSRPSSLKIMLSSTSTASSGTPSSWRPWRRRRLGRSSFKCNY